MRELIQWADDFRKEMIFSASGWRGLFNSDKTETGTGRNIRPEAALVTAGAAVLFARFLRERTGKPGPVIAVGRDTRPTGAALEELVLRGFLMEKACPLSAGITAAPEITAWVQGVPQIDGFFYISASHNPPGYNGFKFGLGDGAVLGPGDNRILKEELFRLLASESDSAQLLNTIWSVEAMAVEELLHQTPFHKEAALGGYRALTTRIAGGEDVLRRIRDKAEKNRTGIAVDFNGSARILSLDRQILPELGLTFHEIGSEPGMFHHALIPEGESLNDCATFIEQKLGAGEPILFGYVPDTDGDRGNLVIPDSRSEVIRPLLAQEVFSLTLLSELCWLKWLGDRSKPIAVAVNGPTSLRVREIAKRLGAKVFEAEVGEANVVGLARRLEQDGWLVRLLGEGSNGGNITLPAVTRDPLNTIFSMLKLCGITTEGNRKGLYDLWREASGLSPSPDHFSLSDILETLPPWTTTEVTDPLAIMKVTSPHPLLKQKYEQLFLKDWEEKKGELESRFGITGWEEINNEGSLSRSGFGPGYRSGGETGCFKILFRDADQNDVGFLWMRGSGTEPVFRVMADLRGDNAEGERYLLQWHRSLIERSDAKRV